MIFRCEVAVKYYT